MTARPGELFFGCVGRTPLVLVAPGLYAKLETYNPTGSIKDRPISYILQRAVRDGSVVPGRTLLVEATSGNTGISLAAVGAALGCPVRVIMPCNMSEERKQMMRHFGARITEVGPSDFPGAIALRDELLSTVPGSWSPMQFENPLNAECHRMTTGPEIHDELPRAVAWSAFVTGAGTGGTLRGVAEFIREQGLDTRVVLVRPDRSERPHGIQGIGDCADYLAVGHYDEVQVVTTGEALERARRFALEAGISVGISAGANLVAAERWMRERRPSGHVVTVLCDRGERYLSSFRREKL